MTDDAFLSRFEAADLDSFTHRDHLRVAFAYARRGGIDHAIDRARHGLRHIASAHGEPERYHETLTTAWARVIAHHALADADTGFDAFLDAHPRLLRRDLLLGHYSRERLFSPTARARFVEPDLLPLP
jgi:hypothetical protein